MASFPPRISNHAQPDPNRVVAAWANVFLKSPKLPNVRLDGVGQIPRRLAAAALFHDLPEHGVIQVAAAVVAHGGTDGFRHLADLCEQFLDRKILKFGMAFESLVEIGDVGPVVLVVVNLHRLRVNVGLERVERVWKRR